MKIKNNLITEQTFINKYICGNCMNFIGFGDSNLKSYCPFCGKKWLEEIKECVHALFDLNNICVDCGKKLKGRELGKRKKMEKE